MSVSDFVGELRAVKLRAGNPSVRELARRVRDERRRRSGLAAAPVSPTTVWYCFDPSRQRLDYDLVFDLLRVLGVADLEPWREAWRQAAGGRPEQPSGTAAAVVGPPGEAAGFVGRAAELDRLLALAATEPVIAVEGMAGAGKTWLARHAAAELAGRYGLTLAVDLHGFDQAQRPAGSRDVLDALLRALDVPAEEVPRGGRPRAYREALRDRRLLLVLDNASDAEQVRPLLAAAPGCLTLVTSRRALTGLGAARIELGPFTPAESLELLGAAAGAERAAEGADAAGRIAELCGHLPLALGLAAGQLRARPDWPLADHAERLTSVGPDGVPGALELSYRGLSEVGQRAFRLLGEHPGPAVTAPGAAALADLPASDAAAVLAGLADEHLLTEVSPGRYAMHDLVRAYAVRRCVEEDPASARRQAFERLYEHWLAAAAGAVRTLYPQNPYRGRPELVAADPAAARAWLEAERPTLLALAGRAATDGWPGDTGELTLQLAAAVRWYLDSASWFADGIALQRHALQAAKARGDRPAQAQALHDLALAESKVGATAAAVAGFTRALALRRELGDRPGQVRSLGQLATTEALRSRYRDALRHLRDALAIVEPADAVARSYLLNSWATVSNKLGEPAAALIALDEAAGIAEAGGDRYGLAWMLNNRGIAHRQLGRPADAVTEHRRALAMHREVGDRAGETFAEGSLGVAYRLLGELPAALEHGGRAVELAAAIGDPGLAAQCDNELAATLHAAGRDAEALAGHRRALAEARRAADRHEQANAQHGLAAVLAGTARAAGHAARAQALFDALGVPPPDQTSLR